MKRTAAVLLALALLICGGCGGAGAYLGAGKAPFGRIYSIKIRPNEAMQALSDRSAEARAFAEGVFDAHMKAAGLGDYCVERSAWGFSASEIDESLYIVGFRYSLGGELGEYGYKIAVDEGGACRVHSSGEELGRFVLGSDS